MPLIKPRTRGKRLVRHRTRLDIENNETLYAYARFLGESTEYVLNQLIDTVLLKDKEFLQWRAANPDSCVPGNTGRLGRKKPSHGRHAVPAVPSSDRPPAPFGTEAAH